MIIKTKYITLFIFLFHFNSKCSNLSKKQNTQCKEISSLKMFDGTAVYEMVDQFPHLKNGKDWRKEILKSLDADFYIFSDKASFQASFHVEIVINKSGEIDLVKISNKEEIDYTPKEKLLIRIIKDLKLIWVPGKCDNVNVNVIMHFLLNL